MRTSRFNLLLVFIIFTVLSCTREEDDLEQDTVVYGTVFDYHDGSPISNAKVHIGFVDEILLDSIYLDSTKTGPSGELNLRLEKEDLRYTTCHVLRLWVDKVGYQPISIWVDCGDVTKTNIGLYVE